MASETYTINSATGIDDALMRIDYRATNIINGGGIAFATISDEPEDIRTGFDNNKFHAIMTDIHQQGVITVNNKQICLKDYYDFESCKTLLLVWFIKDLPNNGIDVPKYAETKTIVCPRTGDIIKQRASTTKYSKKLARLLCQWLWSEGSEIGVSWSDKASQEYESMINSGQV